MKIIIANSIGIDKKGNYIIHSPSRWSEGVTSEAHWFAYYPWELAYLSSLLKARTNNQVKFVDGCLMKLDKRKYLQLIASLDPDMLIVESATRMIEENLELALSVKEKCNSKLVFVGQHASAFPAELQQKGVDYVCIGEYEYTVLDIVKGIAPTDITGLYPNKRRKLLDINSLPWPEDEDVCRLDYGRPGEPSSNFLEVQMYASRGCPGGCNFCVARHVYYDCANWRPRQIKDIVEEIHFLKKKYPQMEGVFFDEEVHNGNKDFILQLTGEIIKAGLNGLNYEAMCDVRFLDEQVLMAMKQAGYYKIRIGIETASIKVMQAMNKKIDLCHIENVLTQAKKIGLTTYGTFTFGAWGSDLESDNQTIRYMSKLIQSDLLDGLQTSICTPEPGTPFYKMAKQAKMLNLNAGFAEYDGGSSALISYPDYTSEQIKKIKNKALLVRDHLYLKKKIKQRKMLDWILGIFSRYGFIGSLNKACRRFVLEIKYLFIGKGSYQK
jgi:radical SAM superfamily enzyme YgiQ (UPF0313 family)